MSNRTAVKQGGEDREQMSPPLQEAIRGMSDIRRYRNPNDPEVLMDMVKRTGDGDIGRGCIPGTNKIDTARRSVSPAENREAAVKTYELEK